MNKTTESKYCDHGIMPFIWYIPVIVIMIIGTFAGFIKEFFFIISGLISIVLCVLIVAINGWSKNIVDPVIPLEVKNSFVIPLGLGGLTSAALALLFMPMILRTTDLMFFAGIDGAMSCLVAIMIIDEDLS